MSRLARVLNQNLIKFTSNSRTMATSSVKYADAVEELKTNPYFEKYSKKIANLQQTSPEEFESRISSVAEKHKPKKSFTPTEEKTFLSGLAKPQLNQLFTKPKQLNDIMKIDLLKDKSAEEIKNIWLQHYKNKDVLVAVIPADSYNKISARGQEYSTFLFPVPRNEGYEFIVSQFYGNEIHFTPLIAYQTHKENAPECLTVVHYPDLMEEKGIVLMKADYNADIIQSHEAQCLINQIQLYYNQDNDKRMKLLQRFTFTPSEFKHMDLIAELECLSIN